MSQDTPYCIYGPDIKFYHVLYGLEIIVSMIYIYIYCIYMVLKFPDHSKFQKIVAIYQPWRTIFNHALLAQRNPFKAWYKSANTGWYSLSTCAHWWLWSQSQKCFHRFSRRCIAAETHSHSKTCQIVFISNDFPSQKLKLTRGIWWYMICPVIFTLATLVFKIRWTASGALGSGDTTSKSST